MALRHKWLLTFLFGLSSLIAIQQTKYLGRPSDPAVNPLGADPSL
jgi:hypothetical protein